MQLCWLLVLPCILVLIQDLRARREYAVSLPPGALAVAERAALMGYTAACPPLWQVLGLFLPALSMAVWRVMVSALVIWAGE